MELVPSPALSPVRMWGRVRARRLRREAKNEVRVFNGPLKSGFVKGSKTAFLLRNR